MSKYGAPIRTKYRLRVENLSTRVSWQVSLPLFGKAQDLKAQDLKDTLRKGGEVTYAEAHTERDREGVVQLATRFNIQT